MSSINGTLPQRMNAMGPTNEPYRPTQITHVPQPKPTYISTQNPGYKYITIDVGTRKYGATSSTAFFASYSSSPRQ